MVNVSREAAAFTAFMKWMEDAERLRTAFQAANLSLPGPLARFFGEHEIRKEDGGEVRVAVPAPKPPSPPPEWRPGWVWIPLDDVGTSSVILATLRRFSVGLVPSVLLQEMQTVLKKTPSAGSVANIGTRLAREGKITREGGVWTITSPDRAPIVTGDFAWGPPDLFETHEIAAHRRLCIEHLLRTQPDGLQIVQMVKNLEGQDWVKAPVAKDLVKEDMNELQRRGLVRQMGNSRKWTLTERGGEE